MIEKQVDIKTPDGVVDCDFVTPAENGQWPAIIMYTDIGGRRDTFREMAQRLAEEGFAVLVPNPFYRLSPAPVYQDFKFGTESTTARMGEVRKFVTPAGVESDARGSRGGFESGVSYSDRVPVSSALVRDSRRPSSGSTINVPSSLFAHGLDR